MEKNRLFYLFPWKYALVLFGLSYSQYIKHLLNQKCYRKFDYSSVFPDDLKFNPNGL